jgi:hypothetical protein
VITVATFSDGLVAGSTLATDRFVITCFNNNSTVILRARYSVINPNLILETLTTSAGAPVTKIFFYRVSETD